MHGRLRTSSTPLSSMPGEWGMKTSVIITVLAIIALGYSPAFGAERACRPSLSNWYHCPDTSKPAPQTTNPRPQTTERTSNSERPAARAFPISGHAQRHPKLDRGLHAPRGLADLVYQMATIALAASPMRRRSPRPLSATGRRSPQRLSGPQERLRWVRTNTALRGRHGLTARLIRGLGKHTFQHLPLSRHSQLRQYVAGAYMCEQEAIALGIRAPKNEMHP
jgi:hypothetical protein